MYVRIRTCTYRYFSMCAPAGGSNVYRRSMDTVFGALYPHAPVLRDSRTEFSDSKCKVFLKRVLAQH